MFGLLVVCLCACLFFFFKQKTAYEMRISDWSSDVCSSDLFALMGAAGLQFEMSDGLREVWGYEPSEANMRKLMETFAYNPGLVTGAIALSRHNASIRPGSHEAYSRLFPEPRQARLDALATPETDIRAIEAPALIRSEEHTSELQSL